jgi:hypothetical protein
MTCEQDRLEKAKQKLMTMNRRVQNAQNLSKKRLAKPLEPMEAPAPAKPPSTLYIFELTESLLADGFSEDFVAEYVGRVESDAKLSEIDLDQRDLALQAEVKKINRAIARITNPKPPADASPKEAPPPPDLSPDSSPSAGYAGMRQARQSPPTPPKKNVPLTPKKPEKERKKKEAKTDEVVVKATRAGAKFLADLMGDDEDPLF